ncbi:iron complex transport system substrate-binding protein [Tamaricihabitans halophyticus]|uniref:Iron complex transport system substrate-binding protein n=1 Tax=Tamaricihabitans halophyticus TaxID=1262583 RepID=A0A4R2Q0R6_9PSEU|nr:iron-siderophore ABC transporter substrate-binding protein [Tamaricihabitans halophyticus]TCP42057.1 iron complex transport system substrate-binding protein [Tamaricihabitans halophyticus]
MSHVSRLAAAISAGVLAFGLAACGTGAGNDDSSAGGGGFEPVTIEHAFGETVIEEKPERVATVNWANHEVPLALGVVPVGMAAADFGDDDDDGVLPWVEDKLDELGAKTPVLFNETDGIDFEAVADTAPDVILAAYSGLTREDYDTLSEIAPVVAFPETAWGTPWQEMIEYNAKGMGMANEGQQLIEKLERDIGKSAAEHGSLQDKSAMFLTHIDTTDLSKVSFYTTHDTRVRFFDDLGLSQPGSIASASKQTDQFSLTRSAEKADSFNDVDIIVTYGDQKLIDALNADPLLSKVPAVANQSIVTLPNSEPIGTAANPTPLAIPWVLDKYLGLLDDAAAKAK